MLRYCALLLVIKTSFCGDFWLQLVILNKLWQLFTLWSIKSCELKRLTLNFRPMVFRVSSENIKLFIKENLNFKDNHENITLYIIKKFLSLQNKHSYTSCNHVCFACSSAVSSEFQQVSWCLKSWKLSNTLQIGLLSRNEVVIAQ